MDRAKPSKRIFFLVVACVIGVSTVGFAVYASKKSTLTPTNTHNAQEMQAVEDSVKAVSELDSDNDGLANWEESLWKTNPTKADSDSDGTSDGDEVKAGRNPIVAGPKDKFTEEEMFGKPSDTEVDSDTTETGGMSRAFFASYLQAKQQGLPLDADTQSKIITEAFSDKILSLTTKQYSASEIKVSGNSDLKIYGNALGLAFYAGTAQDSVSEIEILNNALEKDQAGIEKLDPIIAGYTTISNKLAAVAVPKDLVGLHVELLNSVSRLTADIKGFRGMFDDPLVGLKALGNYYADVDSMQSSIVDIKTVFEKNGVTFAQGEYGAVLVGATK